MSPVTGRSTPLSGSSASRDSTGTFVGFRVNEELSGIGSTTAVGRTPAVTRHDDDRWTTLTATTIEADMTALTTNNSRRDDDARDALGNRSSSRRPRSSLTSPIDLGDAAATGAQDLRHRDRRPDYSRCHEERRRFPSRLSSSATRSWSSVRSTCVFSDFGVTAPSAPIVLSVDDHGQMELQLFFSRA